MNVYQIIVTCPTCQIQSTLILTDNTKSANCDECGEQILNFRRFDGCVYVLKNAKVEGVKIGMTSGDVFSRAKQISGTGVPGNFQVVAAFHSRNPRKDEKKIHTKLARLNIEKEHFNIDPVKAVAKVRTTLGRDWVYLKPQYRQEVEALIEEQRMKAAARFSGGQKSATHEKAQKELFDRADVKKSERSDQREKASRGGVFSFLFD